MKAGELYNIVSGEIDRIGKLHQEQATREIDAEKASVAAHDQSLVLLGNVQCAKSILPLIQQVADAEPKEQVTEAITPEIASPIPEQA